MLVSHLKNSREQPSAFKIVCRIFSASSHFSVNYSILEPADSNSGLHLEPILFDNIVLRQATAVRRVPRTILGKISYCDTNTNPYAHAHIITHHSNKEQGASAAVHIPLCANKYKHTHTHVHKRARFRLA